MSTGSNSVRVFCDGTTVALVQTGTRCVWLRLHRKAAMYGLMQGLMYRFSSFSDSLIRPRPPSQSRFLYFDHIPFRLRVLLFRHESSFQSIEGLIQEVTSNLRILGTRGLIPLPAPTRRETAPATPAI